jgi:hypothetical protein
MKNDREMANCWRNSGRSSGERFLFLSRDRQGADVLFLSRDHKGADRFNPGAVTCRFKD